MKLEMSFSLVIGPRTTRIVGSLALVALVAITFILTGLIGH